MRIFDDIGALNRASAQEIVAIVDASVRERGVCTLVLTGGRTPVGVHGELVNARGDDRTSWTNVEFFWGDERCVPPDHPDSNFRMAWDTLLGPLAVPGPHIHRIAGELPPDTAARSYEREIRRSCHDVPPRFDLVLLGMGEDGHVVSLFPGAPELRETRRVVVPTTSPKPPYERVSLTLPAVNAARNVMFIVAGGAKANALARVHQYGTGDSDEPLPAAMVHPEAGRVLWMVDREAASALEQTASVHNRGSETYVEVYRPASHAELAVIRVRLQDAGIRHYVKNEFASLGSLSAIGADQLILMAESGRAAEARQIALREDQ